MKKVDVNVINEYKQQIEQSEETKKSAYPEIQIIKEKGAEDERVYLNMNFLGLDLSSVPTADAGDFRVYIIPVLYVVSSFISIRITTNMQNGKKKKDGDETEKSEADTVMVSNKMMSYMMPIMSISIAMIAPLGLALYWLVNNVLMTVERLILNKVMENNERNEEKNEI